MGVLLKRPGHYIKFPFKLEDDHRSDHQAVCDFRSKIASSINQVLLKPEAEEVMSLAWFHNCFELIHTNNRAFAKMVAEIDYPMSKWGAKATEEYLSYTLNVLDILNSISSSVSHINSSKVSIMHALSMIKNSTCPANFRKVMPVNPKKDFRPKGIEELRPTTDKEGVVLKGLMVLKKTGFLALGLVLSGLCSDSKAYMKIRELVEVSDDSLTRGLDSRFYKEIIEANGVSVEVREVNSAVDIVSESGLTGRCDEAIGKLKRSLEVVEDSVDGIEKEASNLFSEVLATRNKLLDNIRFTDMNH